MFEINKQIPVAYRYSIDWLDKPDLDTTLEIWLQKLASISTLGQMANRMNGGHVHRRKTVKEFHEVLHCYAYFLDERSEKFRTRQVRPDILGRLSAESQRIDLSIRKLENAYKRVFKEDLLTAEQLTKLTHSVALTSMADRLAIPNAKRYGIEKKIQLVKFWLDDLEHGTSSIDVGVDENGLTDETGLFVTYLGNATTEKARLVLDVLLKDTVKLMRDPSRFKIESTVGASATHSVEWTVEDFKTTIKAEAEAFVGIKKTGKFEFESNHVKASFKAQALVGAQIKGEAELKWDKGGLEASASVDAMVGMKITFESEIEIGDIFLLEASAEGFVGALANAKIEFSATVGGVKLAIGAEVFAGARLTGTMSVGFKAFGVPILKGEVTGSLTAGIGATFKFEFEATGAGGNKLEFEAGVTLGLGAEGGFNLEFNSWNAALAIDALYYTAYTALAYTADEARMRRTYFAGLESNKKLFEWTLEKLELYKTAVEQEYDIAAAVDRELSRIKEIADAKWTPKKTDRVKRGPRIQRSPSITVTAPPKLARR